jgi:hypothetical protein
MNKQEIIEILTEIQTCIYYAGARADGNINGADLVAAIALRCRELSSSLSENQSTGEK